MSDKSKQNAHWEERLRALERKHQTMHRMPAFMGGAAFAFACWIALGASAIHVTEDDATEIVRAKRIEIIDGRGEPQVVLSVDGGAGRIDVTAPEEPRLSNAPVGPAGAINILKQETGRAIVVIGRHSKFGALETYAPNADVIDQPLVEVGGHYLIGEPDRFAGGIFVRSVVGQGEGGASLSANPATGHGELAVFRRNGLAHFEATVED